MKAKEFLKTKKIVIAIALILVLAFTMAACGSDGENGGSTFGKNATELVLGHTNIIENVAEFTLFKVQTTKKITASLAGDIYYDNQNDGETYVDMIFDIKNLKAEDVSSEDFMIASAEGSDGTQYSISLYAVETNNATYVSAYENIAPLSSARFHCAFSVPETETSLKINITVGEEKYSYICVRTQWCLNRTVSRLQQSHWKVSSLNHINEGVSCKPRCLLCAPEAPSRIISFLKSDHPQS